MAHCRGQSSPCWSEVPTCDPSPPRHWSCVFSSFDFISVSESFFLFAAFPNPGSAFFFPRKLCLSLLTSLLSVALHQVSGAHTASISTTLPRETSTNTASSGGTPCQDGSQCHKAFYFGSLLDGDPPQTPSIPTSLLQGFREASLEAFLSTFLLLPPPGWTLRGSEELLLSSHWFGDPPAQGNPHPATLL